MIPRVLSFEPLTTYFLIFGIWALGITLQIFISRDLAADKDERSRGDPC